MERYIFVYPKNGAKIGVCPDTDIWESFDFTNFSNNGRMTIYNLNTLNLSLKYMFQDILDIKNVNTYNQLLHALKEIDGLKYNIDENILDNMSKSLFKEYKKSNLSFVDYLNKLLSPTKNGFEIKKSGDDLPYNCEVWTDSESLLISQDGWNDISAYI